MFFKQPDDNNNHIDSEFFYIRVKNVDDFKKKYPNSKVVDVINEQLDGFFLCVQLSKEDENKLSSAPDNNITLCEKPEVFKLSCGCHNG